MEANIFIEKVIRRLSYKACKVLPYNSSLRPEGYYTTILGKEGLAQQEVVYYTEVFKSYNSDLDTNDAFYNLCTEGLSPQPVTRVPASFVVEIPQGRLQQNILGTSIAIISAKNKLIGELSYQYDKPNVGLPANKLDIFRQRWFASPVHYKGVMFSLLSGSVASTNYFHWLYDALPRLYLLKESGWFDKVDYFLVPRLLHCYHRETLALLGVQAHQLIETDRYTHITADKLIVSSAIRHQGLIPAWVCLYHHAAFVRAESQVDVPLVYVRRGDSKIRQVENEKVLMKMLESLGFRSYLLSELAYEEQVKLFSSAQVIVAAHGAGLANLCYCRQGTAVIELFAEAYIKPTYQIISKRMGLSYHYLICKTAGASEPSTIRQAINAGIFVNLTQLRSILAKVLPAVNHYVNDF